ncbi:MAG: carboxymuconolactone decarboxylase family protein [Planctomycetes bacterium]|nr:carboxymuconolactone decarboxylase family protein [Planctomycetota bacterium]NOG55529.1 carboxymuconolactone decarboxylase family protein [Planctomycetota bacterium]
MSGRRTIAEFREQRCAGQERVLAVDHLGVKRFFNLDTSAYRDGALPAGTKELLGLVASMVLRCNDCIDYHLEQCVLTHGYSEEELVDAMNVALIVGGSIVIPHLRHAMLSLDELMAERGK